VTEEAVILEEELLQLIPITRKREVARQAVFSKQSN
jgi:hypothetical protein